ncbi:MAG: hypothetical protein ACFFCE_00785 [Promethearchaeota archaeon]
MIINKILGIDKDKIIKLQSVYNQSVINNECQYFLTSGAKNFDETIGGGFCKRKKYLIFGANKSGKTQLCHQLCVQAYFQFSDSKENPRFKNEQFIFYFDTENTFRPERIKELIAKYDLELQKILKNILVSKIMSNSAFLLSLEELNNYIGNNSINVLIIDSINNHYNSDLANKKITANKAKGVFFKILTKINELSLSNNFIIIATAQISLNLNTNSLIKVLPIGNNILNHFFSEYVYLDYKEKDKRYVQLVNSLTYPEKKLLFTISPLGIQDYKI